MMSLIRLLMKVLLLPIMLVLFVLRILVKIGIELSSIVLGGMMLIVFGCIINAVIRQMWPSAGILIVMEACLVMICAAAGVLEVRNGSLLVSFISTPDIFMPPFTGQCVVRVNPQILKEDVKAGDTVRVWFDGLVQEIYPPILPNVYRGVKEEQEPAEPEPSETKAGTQREDGFTLTAAFDVS